MTLITHPPGSLDFNPRAAEGERFVDLVKRIDDAIGTISTSNGVGAGFSVDGITAVSTQGDVVATVTTQHVVTTTGDECLATSEADQSVVVSEAVVTDGTQASPVVATSTSFLGRKAGSRT